MARGANKVGTVLGTMEFGRGPCVGNVPQVMTDAFLTFNENYREIDTAYMYCGGKTESILGKMDSWKGKGGKMSTKINCLDGKNFGEESIKSQVWTFYLSIKCLICIIYYLTPLNFYYCC